MPPRHTQQNKNKDVLNNASQEEVSIRKLHELFIKYKFHGARDSKATIKNYRHNFSLLMSFKPSLVLMDLTEETMIHFFEFLNTRKRKVGNEMVVREYRNSSMATLRSKLNGFFNWLVERNYLELNPFSGIPYPEVSYTDNRAFSPKEFEAICLAVNIKIQWANLLIKKRNIAVIMFLFFTGVRKEELIGLKLSDIDLDRKLITIRAETSKSKRSRIIPMNTSLHSYLEDYLFYRKDYHSNALWVSSTLDRCFTEHGAKHLIDHLSKTSRVNCHLHRFRHTFATNYYMKTHDIVGLQKLMGHRSLKMTLSYLRSIPDEHIVEQIRKLSFAEFI